MSHFMYYNRNDSGLEEPDCVARAISLGTGIKYNVAWNLLRLVAGDCECDALNVGCYSYLLEEIFDFPVRYCDDGETVGDIIGMYPNNIVIIRADGHLTCGFYGVLSDLWDCSDMLVDRYWIAY